MDETPQKPADEAIEWEVISYTRSNLEAAVHAILAATGMVAVPLYMEHSRLPRAVRYAAERAWTHQLPEAPVTVLVRRALNELNELGCFKFEE